MSVRFFALALVSSAACSPMPRCAGCTGSAGIVEIAVGNVSVFDYADLTFHDALAVGDLVAGDQSDFFEVDTAYSYTYVSFDIDGVEFTLQPIDYVGETPLEAGRYIYEIDVDDPASGTMSLNLIDG